MENSKTLPIGYKTLIKKFRFYNLTYSTNTEKEIDVRVGANIFLRINFVQEQVHIKEITKKGNILTGLINASFSFYVSYASVLFIIMSALATLQMYNNSNSIILLSAALFASSILFIVSVIYYGIKIESTKRQIVKWLDEDPEVHN